MGRRISATAVLGLALLSLSSCSRQSGSEGTNTYQLPWPTASGDYQLQNVTLDSFDQPETLQGKWARVLVDPFVANGVLESAPPVGRFVRTSEAAVPADYVTLVSTTVYAHLERLHRIDENLKVAQLIRWPLNIGVQANVVDKMDPRNFIQNNALYDGGLDALLIVPYTAEGLPIALNAGILAHEHFHRIFQAVVLDRVRSSAPGFFPVAGAQARRCSWLTQQPLSLEIRPPSSQPFFKDPSDIVVPLEVYNEYVVRGLNEGLADFWGWLYTGDPTYIGRSLPLGESELRRMDIGIRRLESPASLKERLKDAKNADGLKGDGERNLESYRLGTEYARFLHDLSVKISGGNIADLNSRLIVAQALIRALPSLGESIAMKYSREEIAPDSLLKPLYLNLPNVNAAACGLYENFATSENKSAKPMKCASGDGAGGAGAGATPGATPAVGAPQ